MVDENGTGFFGKGRWGRRVFWENIPILHRQLDTEGYLENLLQTWGDECETFISQITALPSQRDPYAVRGRVGEGEWLYVTEALSHESDYYGRVVRLVGEKDYMLMPRTDEADPPSTDADVLAEQYPWFPYAPISRTGRWWTMKWGDADYEVVNVRARNFDPTEIYNPDVSLANEVWVKGGDLTLKFDYLTNQDFTTVGVGGAALIFSVYLPNLPVRLWYNNTPTPTPWLTANAKVVLKVPVDGTLGPDELYFYDVPDGTTPETGNMYIESGVPGEIDTAVSYGTIDYLSGQIQMNLRPLLVSEGGTWANVFVDHLDIGAKWVVRGYFMEFYPPPLIDYLSGDFGFDNDKNDPEDVQRSTIANIVKFFGKKSAQDSYRIRGEISLFNVTATPLWFLCDSYIWSQLPLDHQFEYDGSYYTDIDPRVVKADDIQTDMQFYDPDTSTWVSIVDRQMMIQDDSADGYSQGLAFALDVAQGSYTNRTDATVFGLPRPPATVLSTDPLSDADLLLYGLQAGYRVTVQMWRIQNDAYNFAPGRFGLTEYEKGVKEPAIDDTVFWIDREETAWQLDSYGATSYSDVGHVVYILGVALVGGVPIPGPTVGTDIAIRYWPELIKGDCCYCRSSKLVFDISPTDEAIAYYKTDAKVLEAAVRIKGKLQKLIPIHVRVALWRFTQTVVETLENIYGGMGKLLLAGDNEKDTFQPDASPVFMFDFPLGEDALSIELTKIEQRGDMATPIKKQTVGLSDALLVPFLSIANSTGFSDATTWYDTPGMPVDIKAGVLANAGKIFAGAVSQATIAFGDVRFTFTIVRSI